MNVWFFSLSKYVHALHEDADLGLAHNQVANYLKYVLPIAFVLEKPDENSCHWVEFFEVPIF